MIIHYMQDRDRALPLSPIPRKNWEIDAYPVNEIAEYVQDVSQGDIDVLVEEYYNKYDMILDGRDPEAVSYTQLDVYKRQSPRLSRNLPFPTLNGI